MNLRSLAQMVSFACLLPSLIASAGPITAEQAKTAAVDARRKAHSNPDLFDIVVSDAPLTYRELLALTSHTDVFKSKQWRARLAGRTFWLVEFRIPEDPNLITAGSGSWVFVDAAKGTILGIRHWQ